MLQQLKGKRIAILVADGFEQVEMTSPRSALDDAGAKTQLISPSKDDVQGWNHDKKGDRFVVDISLGEAKIEDFDGLVLPGGVMNPDHLRMIPQAVGFVAGFFRDKKPVAAICHGPWMLVEAGAVKGRTLTSWPSLRTDIENAGGAWVDQPVVRDRGLITSRKPDDLPAFNEAMLEEFASANPLMTRKAS